MAEQQSRRALLGALASLPAATTAATAGTAAARGPGRLADPIPVLFADVERAIALMNDDSLSDAEADRLGELWELNDRQATLSPATTVEGAAASIQWVRRELLQFGFHPGNADNGTRLVLALLDGALGVMRAQMGGPANV